MFPLNRYPFSIAPDEIVIMSISSRRVGCTLHFLDGLPLQDRGVMCEPVGPGTGQGGDEAARDGKHAFTFSIPPHRDCDFRLIVCRPPIRRVPESHLTKPLMRRAVQ